MATSKTRIPKAVLKKLKSARADATFVQASFGFGPEDTVTRKRDGTVMRVDVFIKETTRNYMQSYVIAYLDHVINWAERKEP